MKPNSCCASLSAGLRRFAHQSDSFGRQIGYAEQYKQRASFFNGGGQIGYNFQCGRIVLGPEFDLGYMNLDGTGDERIREEAAGIAHGSSDSDFYTTLRVRLGYALGALVSAHEECLRDPRGGAGGRGVVPKL